MTFILHGETWSFFFFFFLLVMTASHPKPGPAAQGELQARIEDLGRKVGVRISGSQTWSWDQTNVCIVHDTFRWWVATASQVSYIFVPLRFLQWFSRKEIDGLIARQLRPKRTAGSYSAILVVVLLYAVAAASILKWWQIDPRTHWVAMLLLVVAEVVVIAVYWPHVALQTHLRAIQVTGDAESYISFLAELSRLNKTPLDESVLITIAQKTSVTPERLQNLVRYRLQAAEDRYPIDERYLKSGR